MGEKELRAETTSEIVKAVPAIGGAAYAGITLNEWAAIATICYVIVQAAILIHKHYWAVQDRKK